MMVSHSVERVLETYQESLSIDLALFDLKIENLNKLQDKENNLILWLKSEYHPKVLTDEVVKMINDYSFTQKLKKKDYYRKFISWIFINKKLVSDISKKKRYSVTFNDKMNEILLIRFKDFLDDLSNLLNI